METAEESLPGWSARVCSKWSCEQVPLESTQHHSPPSPFRAASPFQNLRNRKTPQIWNLCLSGLLSIENQDLNSLLLFFILPLGTTDCTGGSVTLYVLLWNPFQEPKAPQWEVLKPIPSLLYPTYLLVQVIWDIQIGSTDQDAVGRNRPKLECTQVAMLKVSQVATMDLN